MLLLSSHHGKIEKIWRKYPPDFFYMELVLLTVIIVESHTYRRENITHPRRVFLPYGATTRPPIHPTLLRFFPWEEEVRGE